MYKCVLPSKYITCIYVQTTPHVLSNDTLTNRRSDKLSLLLKHCFIISLSLVFSPPVFLSELLKRFDG